MNTITESRWYPLFNWLVNHPWLMLTLGVLFIAISASGLTRLVKDTSVDAFVPEGHSSLLANERTTELFGLSEPIAIAVFVEPGRSVFDAPTMAVIAELTERVAEVDNINSERVASIATESYIRGEDGAILVEDYLEQTDYATPAEIQGHWNNMPPHINTLVSEDARGAVIMAEVIDSHASAATYLNVQALVEEFAEPGLEIYIAGPAAVSGYLSEYIDGDARIMQPIVFLVVIVFLYLAFMKSSALLGPIVVLLGSAGGSLGIMAWQGIPYYAITNALPVILVSISVADAIHILSAYFEDRAENPQRAQREAVICAMLNMARPITLTTITTIAGFFGIAAVSIMPPIYYFAVYAMLGIFLAWCFSLFILPAVLVLIKPSQSRFFVNWKMDTPDRIGMALGRISLAGLARPGQVLLGAAIIVAIAWMGASSLTIDRSQVDNFSKDEPIHIADDLINERFAGTAFLDVILHSEEPDGMLLPHNMQKVAALQSFLEGQEHVAKTVSIADYITLLDSAINAKVPDAQRTIPTQEGAVAQYLMVYEASGDPTDFEEEITPDYQTVLVRTVLDSHYFSDSKKVVTALQAYLDQEFSSPDLQATIAGDVNVSYHWMTALQTTHFLGIGISLLLIFVTSAIVFRSLPVGVIAVIPVTFTVLCLYGLMGYLGINLEPATSMFAAISVGVGVDFAIHLIDRIFNEQRLGAKDLYSAVRRAAPSTARACFFNAAALGIGFSVLLVSDLPTLQRFGGLVAMASLSAYVAALLIIPASLKLISRWLPNLRLVKVASASAVVLVGVLTLSAGEVQANITDGRDVAEKIAERPEAPSILRTISMTLTDKRGRVRNREALILRKTGAQVRSTRITYLAPKAVRELTFLSKDYLQVTRSDERWLYIPAVGKVRRIPASSRGDYFLGTDFTFEDMQSDLKFNLQDYNFTYADKVDYASRPAHKISGLPVSKKVARQLGYGRFSAIVDEQTWFPLKIEFFDVKDKPLKTVVVDGLKKVDNYWTPTTIQASNHRSGHTTLFEYIQVEHPEQLGANLFAAQELTRGLPRQW